MADSPPDKRVTIRDVAEATGVAVSTVSRALTLPDRVNRQTQVRIQEAARNLGYVTRPRPRTHSPSLRSIAVVVSDVTNPFYFDLIRGAQHQLASAGWSQLLVDTEESTEAELDALMSLSAKAEGVVLAASRLTDAQIGQIAERFPLVVINRRPPGVPTVLIDSPGGFEQAVEHLASLGHRHIAYIAGPETSWSNERRRRATISAGKKLGVKVTALGPYVPFLDAGAAAADSAINAGVTACVAFNDLIAIGMLNRLRQRGLEVPRDMSVVGCDDIFGADFCHPPLTTMASPIQRAGRVAVTMLLARLGVTSRAYPDEETVVLPTHLTIRESTGIVPTAAPHSHEGTTL